MRLLHTMLRVGDLDRSLDFYTRVLGMRVLRRKDYLLRADAIFLSNVFQVMDNGKARRELGWNPRPVAETVRDAVAWFKTRG